MFIPRKQIAKQIEAFDAGIAVSHINIAKINQHLIECNKGLEDAKKLKGDEKENAIKTHKDQIAEHEREMKANIDMIGTMNAIRENLVSQYFSGIIGKFLLFIYK